MNKTPALEGSATAGPSLWEGEGQGQGGRGSRSLLLPPAGRGFQPPARKEAEDLALLSKGWTSVEEPARSPFSRALNPPATAFQSVQRECEEVSGPVGPAATHLELGVPATGHRGVLPWPAPGPLASLPVLHLLLVFPKDNHQSGWEKPCAHTLSSPHGKPRPSNTLTLGACESLPSSLPL